MSSLSALSFLSDPRASPEFDATTRSNAAASAMNNAGVDDAGSLRWSEVELTASSHSVSQMISENNDDDDVNQSTQYHDHEVVSNLQFIHHHH